MTRNARKMRKYLLLVACIALVLGVAIGGTIAWLADTTQTVTNTFSPTNIDLTLKESGTTEVDGNDTKAYTVIPGVDMAKDPKVSASSDVDYYVFVKVDAPNWTVDSTTHKSYSAINGNVTCSIASDWTYLTVIDGASGVKSYVYYKAMSANSPVEDASILTGNMVYVSEDLTDEQLQSAKDAMPSLTFTAYAIQQASGDGTTFSASDAWEKVKGGNLK